jgi:hypothetical protein
MLPDPIRVPIVSGSALQTSLCMEEAQQVVFA